MAKLCDHGYFLEVAPRSCPKCRTDLDLIQREEIAALKSTISRLTSERDAAELFSLALKDKCGSTISRLREYVGHKPDCCSSHLPNCDCGYDELMKELDESK